MQVRELEELDARLRSLRERLYAERQRDCRLDEQDALVQAAQACEFMLPEDLTVGTLAETVERKIDNVQVLLERARKHEDLPDAAQIAAGEEYMTGMGDHPDVQERPRQ